MPTLLVSERFMVVVDAIKYLRYSRDMETTEVLGTIQSLSVMIGGEIVGDTIRHGHFTIRCSMTGDIEMSSNMNPYFRVWLGSIASKPETLAHTFDL